MLQRRSADKDLYPGLWDFAVGEHLTPGESYVAAAARGVLEELGVETQPTLLGEPVRYVWEDLAVGVSDKELQQAFSVTHDGPFDVDPLEVAEVRWFDLAAIRRWLGRSPADFTPWFVAEAERLSLF